MNGHLTRTRTLWHRISHPFQVFIGEFNLNPLMVSQESPGKMGNCGRNTHHETTTYPTTRTNDPTATHRTCTQCESVGDAGWSQFINNHSTRKRWHQGTSGRQVGTTCRGTGAQVGRCRRDSRIPRLRRTAGIRAISPRQVPRTVRSGYGGTGPSLQGTAGHQPGHCRLEGHRRLTWTGRASQGYLGIARAPKRCGCLSAAASDRSRS